MFFKKITKNKAVLFFLCLVTITIIFYTDYIIGYQVQITIFYVVPIYFSSWYIGKYCGYFICLLCTFSTTLANYLSGQVYSNYNILLWNILISFTMYLVISFTLWRLKVNADMNYHHAITDPLTNILNRKGLYENSAKLLDKCKKDNTPIAIAFIDCDNFKTINDEKGHEIGDSVLQVVAFTINMNLRSLDLVARLGGDEFVIILIGGNVDDMKSGIYSINEKLIDAMNRNEWAVTFSIGLITFNKVPNSIGKAITMADNLMFKVKRNGKNGIAYQEIS